jgi:hypothetical protein
MQTTIETIKINDKEYITREAAEALLRPVLGAMPRSGPVRIVILQRGWVVVGRHRVIDENTHALDGAAVVRQWGTTKGLGQIALDGPTSKTVLDPCGTIEYHPLAAVASMICTEEAWAGKLD